MSEHSTKKDRVSECNNRGIAGRAPRVAACAAAMAVLFMPIPALGQPANDDCFSSIEVFTGIPFQGNTSGATGTNDSSCAGAADTADVWHFWVADCTGLVTVSLCGSDFDTSLAIYDPFCPVAPANEHACNDDATGVCSPQSQITFEAFAGFTYAIRVAGFGGATGNYSLLVTCPPLGACCSGAGTCADLTEADCDLLGGHYLGDNTTCEFNGVSCATGACCAAAGCDDTGDEGACITVGGEYAGDGTTCADVQCGGACCTQGACTDVVSSSACGDLGGTYLGNGTACASSVCNDECFNAIEVFEGVPYSGTTVGATGTDITSCTNGDTRDVWHTFIAPCNGTITAQLCDSSFDTSLAVYDSCGGLELACNDDDVTGTCPFLRSLLTFNAVQSTEYVIRVSGFNNNTGNYTLLITCPPIGACCLIDSCQDLTQEECSLAGGTYLGDDTTCAANGAACDVGACCLPDFTCDDTGDFDDCLAAGGNYFGDGTSCATTICPTPGDNCSDPLPINLPGDLTPSYVNLNTTCGRLNDYSATCMGNFDNGEDIIYQLNVTEQVCVNITVNSDTIWTGVAIDDICPFDSACMAQAITSTNPDVMSNVLLAPGTYFLMVDTFAAPNCTNFTLTIERCPTGACCIGGGQCGILSPAECAAVGGLYLGTDTTCEVEGIACATGACCNLSAGTCVDVSGATAEIDCGDADQIYRGDGTSCAGANCPGQGFIPLNYNWNGLVHAGENGQPDSTDGYRSIGDRGLTVGNANSLGGAAASLVVGDLTYYLETRNTPDLDTVHIGFRRDPFDLAVDGDDVGIPPSWDPSIAGDGKNVPSSTTVISPTQPLDASFRLGILYNASENGGDFDMTLGFTDNSSVTVRFDAPDWFANNNGNAQAPQPGVASQTRLPGPLSGGDGFEGTAFVDRANLDQPLNIIEGVVTAASLLNGPQAFDVVGKQLNSITFSNWSPNSVGNMAAGVGIYAASMVVPSGGGCACRGDLSGNGALAGDDVQGFVDCLLGAGGDCTCADVDGVGGVNDADIDEFITALLDGPACP